MVIIRCLDMGSNTPTFHPIRAIIRAIRAIRVIRVILNTIFGYYHIRASSDDAGLLGAIRFIRVIRSTLTL